MKIYHNLRHIKARAWGLCPAKGFTICTLRDFHAKFLEVFLSTGIATGISLLFALSIGLFSCAKQGNEPRPNKSQTAPNRPKLPIEYMAERNVGASPTAFASTDVWHESGYFTQEELATLIVEGYHLPTPEEMNGVLPIPHHNQPSSNPNGYAKVYVGIPKEYNAVPPIPIRDNEEILQVGGERLVCQSLYGIVGALTNKRVSYALRFWDEGERKYFSAFRYEVQPLKRMLRIDENLAEYRLQIRVRYLGKDSPLSLTQHDLELVSNDAYWAKDNEHDIVRYLPNCGYIFDASQPERVPNKLEINGRYWLKESGIESLKRYRYVDITNRAVGMDGHHLFSRLPVRLFSDK